MIRDVRMIHDTASTKSHPVSRRTLIGAGLATALVGVMSPWESAWASAPATVAVLRGKDPFYIAHRGGGRNWPELTAYAYEQAAKIPHLLALEVSVCISRDGVLVCSHDKLTTQATGIPYTIADETWETLSSLKVTAADTLKPWQPARPFTRLDDVVDAYIDDFVLFVEPKASAAGDALMARMVAVQQPERVVWKQPINSRRFAAAKDNGFTTWGYVLNEPDHLGTNLQRYAASADIDMLGAPRSESDDFVTDIVTAADQNGKQTIMWEIRSVADRTRALALGCTGMMTSNVVDVVNAPL